MSVAPSGSKNFMSPPAGGSIIGANHPHGGFVNGQVEAAWIATFVMI